MSFLNPVTDGIELGVNIDHVATVRNARGTAYPNPIEAALLAEEAGANAITLHVREDRRHIREEDAFKLKPLLRSRMNLECAVTAEMLELACRIKPHDVCLVPERRAEVTTEGGLDVLGSLGRVKAAVEQLKDEGIRVSLFIDPQAAQIEAAAQVGAQVIELHTGCYAGMLDKQSKARELERIQKSVEVGRCYGLRVNAGHGLHYTNVQAIAALPDISELNIGHAIISRAIFTGLYNAVRDMKSVVRTARIGGI